MGKQGLGRSDLHPKQKLSPRKHTFVEINPIHITNLRDI